jgi:DMSO/TMAO reductase YedYZ molybdopterin-dependent catalytic subunit
MVDRPLEITFDQLLARDLVERDVTLSCVSNEVGGPYAGNARWIGALLRPILEEAGVHPDADQLVSRSADGMTIGTPTAAVMDGRDAMLAVAMNGEPLPIAHGFPVRMIVPGLYGYVSATKWVVEIEATTFDAFDAYWAERGWAEEPPAVKTMSRIDTPRPLAAVGRGTVAVAATAWRSASTRVGGTPRNLQRFRTSTRGASGSGGGTRRRDHTRCRSGPPTATVRRSPKTACRPSPKVRRGGIPSS